MIQIVPVNVCLYETVYFECVCVCVCMCVRERHRERTKGRFGRRVWLCWLIFCSSLRDTQIQSSCWFPLACVHTVTDTVHKFTIQSQWAAHCSVHMHIHSMSILHKGDTSYFSTKLHYFIVGSLFLSFMVQWNLLLFACRTAFPRRPPCQPIISTVAGLLSAHSFSSTGSPPPLQKTPALSRRQTLSGQEKTPGSNQKRFFFYPFFIVGLNILLCRCLHAIYIQHSSDLMLLCLCHFHLHT